MGLLNNTSKLFWDKNVSPITLNMYNETAARRWLVSDFHILDDKSEWMSISFDKREDVLTGLVFSNAIKQSFGTVLLPILSTAIPLSEMATKAMISTISSQLSGGHAQLLSLMINGLNSNIGIEKAIKRVNELKGLENILNVSEKTYAGMYGWTAASAEGIMHPDFNTFNELHYSIWQSAALSIVLLSMADSISVASLFNLLEQGYKLPGMCKAMKTMSKDISLIKTYLTMAAGDSFRVLPQDRQEQGKQWLQSVISQDVIIAWSEENDRFLIDENKNLATKYFRYNINKALVTLHFYPKEKIEGMPPLIEKYLGVSTDRWIKEGQEAAAKRARRRWW